MTTARISLLEAYPQEECVNKLNACKGTINLSNVSKINTRRVGKVQIASLRGERVEKAGLSQAVKSP